MLRVRMLRDAGVGKPAGKVLDVAAGYAKAYLVPQGFAELVEESKEEAEADRLAVSELALDTSAVLEEFRRQMYRGGVRKWSVGGLNRMMERADETGDGRLDMQEFTEAINRFGVHLNSQAMGTLFRVFDTSGDERIDAEEFLRGLRGPLNERRFRIVQKAWQAVGGGAPVSPEQVLAAADTSGHPAVASGQAKPEEVRAHAESMLARWSGDSGVLDEAGFFKYWTELGATTDSDELFVAMVERQFGVSERDEVQAVEGLVDKFRTELLSKLDQKTFHGSGPRRTLLEAFRFVDLDSSGKVGAAEFARAMERFGLRGPEVAQVFAYVDRSGDQQIDVAEFVDAFS